MAAVSSGSRFAQLGQASPARGGILTVRRFRSAHILRSEVGAARRPSEMGVKLVRERDLTNPQRGV